MDTFAQLRQARARASTANSGYSLQVVIFGGVAALLAGITIGMYINTTPATLGSPFLVQGLFAERPGPAPSPTGSQGQNHSKASSPVPSSSSPSTASHEWTAAHRAAPLTPEIPPQCSHLKHISPKPQPPESGPPYYIKGALRDQWISPMYQTLPLKGDQHSRADGAMAIMAGIGSFQRQLGIQGGVAEIGVHHGMYFLSVAAMARKGEVVLAMDIFEKAQHLNIDKSGNGNEALLQHNLKTVGFDAQDKNFIVHRGSSTDLSPSDFCGLTKGQRLRVFHIDGGHTADILMNDLFFAECALAEGGLAILDDFSNLYWSGVLQGVVTYFNTYWGTSRLAPFLLSHNKLYITTKAYHQRFLDHVLSWPLWYDACTSTLNMKDGKKHCIQAPGYPSLDVSPGSKFNFSGYPFAIAEWPKTFDKNTMIAFWRSHSVTM